jgi:hypothetical protein
MPRGTYSSDVFLDAAELCGRLRRHSNFERTIIMAERNDPCPCGSGKKYKQCCLHKEKEQNTNAEDPWSQTLLYVVGAAIVITIGALVLNAAQVG